MTNKPNCGAYRLTLRPGASPILTKFAGWDFAMCTDCREKAEKDFNYVQKAIVEWAMAEDILEKSQTNKKRKK